MTQAERFGFETITRLSSRSVRRRSQPPRSVLAMNTTMTPSRPEAAHWEPKYPFDLVVSYEDTTTRNHALQLYDHLAQKLLDDYDFQCTWWKFDHLRNSTLMEQAVDAAAEANMIIMTIRAGKELPAIARKWVDQWVGRKDNRKSALVAVIAGVEPQRREACPAQLYLQKVARTAKMDFFSHAFNLPKEPPSYSVETIAERAEKVTPLLEEILHQKATILRWGINE